MTLKEWLAEWGVGAEDFDVIRSVAKPGGLIYLRLSPGSGRRASPQMMSEMRVEGQTVAPGWFRLDSWDRGQASLLDMRFGYLTIVGGKGIGQTRRIENVDDSFRALDLAREWKVQPDPDSVFRVFFDTGHPFTRG